MDNKFKDYLHEMLSMDHVSEICWSAIQTTIESTIGHSKLEAQTLVDKLDLWTAVLNNKQDKSEAKLRTSTFLMS